MSLWKNGLINKDSGCDIKIVNSPNEIKLTVRILDHLKQLNLDEVSFQEIALSVSLEYSLIIKRALTDYSTPYNVSLTLFTLIN